MILPNICDIHHLDEKTVIVRAGLNVPLDAQGVIQDDFRIQRFLPTLHYLIEQEAKIIIISHIGREKTDTLLPVYEYLQKHVPLEFKASFFAGDVNENIKQLSVEVAKSPQGSVFLLDNVRQTPQEQENDATLAELLGNLAEVYVNEAFSVSHRNHMSMVGIPEFVKEKATGIACGEEVEQLSLALSPPRKSVAVISGNKFETKLPLITRFLETYDTIIVGGALANTLYDLAGYNIGKSVYDDELDADTIENLQKVLTSEKLYLPAIVVVSNSEGEKITKEISEVGDDDYIYDIAPEALIDLEPTITESNLVVWNGPLGYYEKGYIEGTERLLEMVVGSQTQSIVGGGNTVDAVRNMGYEDKVSFLSTGGGAMIDYMTQGTLPALEVLRKK